MGEFVIAFIFMQKPIVISLFDRTMNMVAPSALAGFLCYCVDLQHQSGEQREGNIIRVGSDVRDWLRRSRL